MIFLVLYPRPDITYWVTGHKTPSYLLRSSPLLLVTGGYLSTFSSFFKTFESWHPLTQWRLARQLVENTAKRHSWPHVRLPEASLVLSLVPCEHVTLVSGITEGRLCVQSERARTLVLCRQSRCPSLKKTKLGHSFRADNHVVRRYQNKA